MTQSGDDGAASDGSDRTAFPDSLCHTCASHRYVDTKTSRFVLCAALPVKYPRQPITSCPAYRRTPA